MRVSRSRFIFVGAPKGRYSRFFSVKPGYFVFVLHLECKNVICTDPQISEILLHQNVRHRNYSHRFLSGKKGRSSF